MIDDQEAGPRWEVVVVVLLLCLGAALRLVALGDNPPGLFRDEWEKGYTALEFWSVGRHGVIGLEGVRVAGPFALFVEVFEGHDRTSSIYQWAAAPFVGLLGLGPVSTRLPAALAGIGCLIFGWLLARRSLGPLGGLALLAVLCVQPTHLLFSRWAQQGILSVFWFLVAMYVVLRGTESSGRQARLLGLAAGLCFGVSVWAYDPARLTVPVVVGLWIVLWGWRQYRPVALSVGLALAVIWIPLAVYTLTAGSSRLGRVMLSEGNPVAAFLVNYLSHFDPRYWFLTGDANPRHSLPLSGWTGWLTGFFAVIGAGLFARAIWTRQRLEEWSGLGLIILLVGPIAAALTREGSPHALRSGLMIVGLAMLATAGIRALGGRRSLVAIGAVVLIDGAVSVAGLMRQREPSIHWESGTLETLRAGLERGGPVLLDTGVMYAPYAALFVERTDPRAYHELGLGALKTQIVPTAFVGFFPPGASIIAPPQPPMRLEWMEHSVVLRDKEGLWAWSATERALVRLD